MPVTSPSTSSVGSVDDQGIPPIADMAARLHPGHDRTYQRLRDRYRFRRRGPIPSGARGVMVIWSLLGRNDGG
jgi:hypothetical protein